MLNFVSAPYIPTCNLNESHSKFSVIIIVNWHFDLFFIFPNGKINKINAHEHLSFSADGRTFLKKKKSIMTF